MTAHKHIKIAKREDLQVGDIATFAYHDHEFTGVVWSQAGRAMIGKIPLGTAEEWDPDLTFVQATRPAPALPTEPGAVILVTECRGERVNEQVPALCDGEGEWRTWGRTFGGFLWHRPADITEWFEARVVPKEEVR